MKNTLLDEWPMRIREATASGRPLQIQGGGSKAFYGLPAGGEILDTRGYSGIIEYEPTELVITARCGTPLAELEAAVAERGQMLAFEAPRFSVAEPTGRRGAFGATLGGCVATGLSGPRRVAAGAVRDFVLGVAMVNGHGQILSFGGQVMKNVAGFDVSRLMVGAMGTLGLILEVSLKVLPRPVAEATLYFSTTQEEALGKLNEWGGQPLPISASAWYDGDLGVRLSGAAAAVESACRKLGGERVDATQAANFWVSMREQTDAFFSEDDLPLWRLSVPSDTPPLLLAGRQLIEWGGALRWFKTDADPLAVRSVAARAGGHATLFRAPDDMRAAVGAFHPLPPAQLALHQRLKVAFDPAGVFNPGRMYADF